MPFLDYSFLFIYRFVPIHFLMILQKALGLFQDFSLPPSPLLPYARYPIKSSSCIYFLSQLMFALGPKLQNAQQTGLNMEATATKYFK